MTPDQLAPQVMDRLETLGRISDEPDRLTRTFASPAMRRANKLVAEWMRDAGMTLRNDALGNLIGHLPASRTVSRCEPRSSVFAWGTLAG